MSGDAQERGAAGWLSATGHAVLNFRNTRIEAETIEFRPDSGRQNVRASGSVLFRRGDSAFHCAELRLELSSGRGEIRLE